MSPEKMKKMVKTNIMLVQISSKNLLILLNNLKTLKKHRHSYFVVMKSKVSKILLMQDLMKMIFQLLHKIEQLLKNT